ncbi:hypothetical protein ACHRVW_12055 [Flavobacterium collinsii]|uniref:Lipoprotein n=1 Tax=Flavobacterium reichenbachii TaxID=362418 RepID=A0A085ZJ69_9FLAO|nr:hypothetical protein [Flavobacterium reichenbachii]KFF04483.1 hypothetical protein IW19_02585 [Flavobacterium reichenbachii]OXB14458.1 hypothetical protein B0A68_12500 [Flavobacterium reichenbachii]
MKLILQNNFLKLIILLLGLKLSVSCNTKSNNPEESKEKIIVDTLNTYKSKPEKKSGKIDSVKMHAFDDLYFGIQSEITSKKYSVNDIDYSVASSGSEPGKGLFYFMLESKSNITTQKKADRVLNELKKTISKKYGNGENINKTYYIKHPEEKEKAEDFFGKRALYKYDKKIIGLPYEVVKSKWDLKYKEIKIGYLIEHKNRTVYYQSSPEDNNYIIYIELTSKVIKSENENSDNKNAEKDSNKF